MSSIVLAFPGMTGMIHPDANNSNAQYTPYPISLSTPIPDLHKLLYSCSERILPLSLNEIEKVRAGTLDLSSVIRPPPDDHVLARSGGARGSGAGYGTSGSTVDSKSLELMALLRQKSYAMFTPAERMRLLRGLCDLAASTGPIKEHLQVRLRDSFCRRYWRVGSVRGREPIEESPEF